MAIDNQFGKGIGLAAGFDLGAQKPLDSRLAVNTIAERDAHVTENRAFEGMIVFVDETKKNYQLVNGEWVELFLDEQNRLAALETQLNGGEGEEGNGVLAELQDAIDDVNARLNSNGDIDNRIAQNASDIDALEKELADEIGVPSVPADENGEGAVQASGMHKVVEDSAAELKTEILGVMSSANNAVAAEESRATAAEEALDKAIDQEVLDRQAADEALGGRIDAANQALADQLNPDKDGSLQKQLNDEIARAKQAESDIQSALDAEEERAGLAEQGLQAAIDTINDANNGILAQAEAKDQARADVQKLVDDAQDKRIKALEDANAEGGVVKEAIDQVQANLDAFEQAQEAKNGELDAEDERLDQAIKDEASAARAAEQKLEQDLAAEIARADAAEKANAQAIEDEAARADAEEKRIVGLVEAEVTRAEGQEAAIRQEMADAIGQHAAEGVEASGLRKEIDDAVATESALRVAEEQRIEQECEAAMAQEVKDRNAAIKVETDRAVAEEGKLQAAIEKEVDDREAAVLAEENARKAADEALDARIDALEAATGEGGSLEARVAANEDAIEVINGTGEGSIKKAVADLVDGAPEALDTLNELAAALRDNANVLDAVETAFDGKLATLQADVNQNEADCDAAIAAEQQRAEGQEAAIRGEFAAADTALHTTISAEIDADVKVEADRAKAEEAAIREELADAIEQEVIDRNAAILVEQQRAEGVEAAIRQELADEKAALQAEIDADVKVVADELANQKNAELEGSLANQIADEVARAQGVEGDLQTAINNEEQAREEADDALDERLQAVEASLGMGEGNEGTEGIASRVENLEIAVGKAAEGEETATGLHLLIDNKIAEVNGNVQEAVSGLNGSIAAEQARAEAEEGRLAGLITDEETRAKGEESRIEGLVTAEVARAKAAEEANANNITNLQNALDAHLTAVSCGDDTAYTDLPNLTPPQA